MQGLLDRLHFKFMVNYHSFGQLLLYSFGWQVQTPVGGQPDLSRAVGDGCQPGDPRL